MSGYFKHLSSDLREYLTLATNGPLVNNGKYFRKKERALRRMPRCFPFQRQQVEKQHTL